MENKWLRETIDKDTSLGQPAREERGLNEGRNSIAGEEGTESKAFLEWKEQI